MKVIFVLSYLMYFGHIMMCGCRVIWIWSWPSFQLIRVLRSLAFLALWEGVNCSFWRQKQLHELGGSPHLHRDTPSLASFDSCWHVAQLFSYIGTFYFIDTLSEYHKYGSAVKIFLHVVFSGGRNGYGAKLCNIFSTKFTVETACKEYKHSFKQV